NMTNRYRAVYSEGIGYEPDYDNFTQYMWDSRNLLTKVTAIVGGDSTDYTFAYDALGRRESMTADGTTTDYFYEGLGVLVEKTGAVTKSYLRSGGAVGAIISVDDGDDLTYYHYDAIGNVVLTTSDQGGAVGAFVQDAFGNVISGTASGYHLTTKEYFADFGLYYFNARWYDPFTGRFISRAPVCPDKEHPYVYCENDPVMSVDPDGRRSIPSGAGWCCVAAACKPCEDKVQLLPEDGWSNQDEDPWVDPPPPGFCAPCDMIATPKARLKVPDNYICMVRCDKKGNPKDLKCWGWHILIWDPLPYPEVDPPGFPANPLY
ncbi:RHS repeat domain-containing protein, partial [Candidatus Sumerlaeota bacterium]